jgi:hypothetical protein
VPFPFVNKIRLISLSAYQLISLSAYQLISLSAYQLKIDERKLKLSSQINSMARDARDSACFSLEGGYPLQSDRLQ